MRSRDAWFAAIAAALGISEAACKREASVTTIAPMTTAAPSASATTIVETTEAPSASASVAPSAVEVASAKPVPTVQPRPHPLACGAMPREQSAICGASPNMKGLTVAVQTNVTSTNDADRAIVASLRQRLKSCATRGLARDPTEQGTAVVSATIDATGQVTAASLASSAGLDSGTAGCMVAAVRSKPFGAGAPRTIQIHIQTVKEN